MTRVSDYFRLKALIFSFWNFLSNPQAFFNILSILRLFSFNFSQKKGKVWKREKCPVGYLSLYFPHSLCKRKACWLFRSRAALYYRFFCTERKCIFEKMFFFRKNREIKKIFERLRKTIRRTNTRRFTGFSTADDRNEWLLGNIQTRDSEIRK